MIVIIDYQMGNVGSILNMLKKIGIAGSLSSHAADIRKADKLILPGVGAFDQGVTNLERLGLIPVLEEMVLQKKTPVLGICLGMQLMTKTSEEGKSAGLGWVDARTIRFQHDPMRNLKVPHMGWNTIAPTKESALLREMRPQTRFYFVHSYHAVCNRHEDVLTTTMYGYEFVSAFQHENIAGVQFHPEKSHRFGMWLLRNFAEATVC